MEAWIGEHPWWTAAIVYVVVSTGVVIGVWSNRFDDDDGQPATTLGGYVIAFLLWWVPYLLWLFIRLFLNWGIPKRNRRPPRK